MSEMATKPITSFQATGPDAPPVTPLFEFHEILSGDPRQSGFSTNDDPAGKFETGIWECTPGKFVVDRYYVDCFEFVHILEGKVTITDVDGHSKTYQAGDNLITPKGFKGTWEVVEPMRKVFAMHKC